MKQIELRFVPEKTGLVDSQVFEQRGELLLPFPAGEQPVVAVEGVELADFQAALQAVAKKVRPPLVEVHSALLIDQGL